MNRHPPVCCPDDVDARCKLDGTALFVLPGYRDRSVLVAGISRRPAGWAESDAAEGTLIVPDHLSLAAIVTEIPCGMQQSQRKLKERCSVRRRYSTLRCIRG